MPFQTPQPGRREPADDSEPPLAFLWFMRIVKVYSILFMTAVGGLVAANIGGVLGMMVAEDMRAQNAQPFVHGGWVVGTVLAFIGAVSGKLRFINGSQSARKDVADGDEQLTTDEPPINDAPDELEMPAGEEPVKTAKGAKSGVVSSAVFFGLAAGFLGAMLGFSLLAFWFSYAYSPFATRHVVASVTTTSDTMQPSKKRTVHATSNRTVIYCAAAPAVLGLVGGAVAGAIGASLGLVRDG